MKVGDLVRYTKSPGFVTITKDYRNKKVKTDDLVFLITDVKDSSLGPKQALCVGPNMEGGRWIHATSLKVISNSD